MLYFFSLGPVGSYQTHTPPFPYPHIERQSLNYRVAREIPPQILNIYIMH